MVGKAGEKKKPQPKHVGVEPKADTVITGPHAQNKTATSMTVRLPSDRSLPERDDKENLAGVPPVPSSLLDNEAPMFGADSSKPTGLFRQGGSSGGLAGFSLPSLAGDEGTRKMMSYATIMLIYLFALSMLPFCYTKDVVHLKWPLYVLLFAGFISVALRSL